MIRSILSAVVVLLSLFAFTVLAALAQTGDGFIEGNVFLDEDGNGVCEGTGEPGQSGIRIELVNLDDDTTIAVTSGSGGLFEADELDEGTWQITVDPGSQWSVTSPQTLEYDIDEDVTDIDGVVFCITPQSAPTATPTATPPQPANAGDGSISGFVYNDVNGDGTCSSTGEVGQPGINMQLVDLQTDVTRNVTTIGNGSFLLSGAALGTWQVTVNPGAGWRVTSPQTQQVVLSASVPDVQSSDFCIVRTGATVLPESGAPAAPALLLAAGLGVFFLLLGGVLLLRSNRAP